MRKITTVCGDITPQELGRTSMHEHTIYNSSELQLYMIRAIPNMISGTRNFKKEQKAELKTNQIQPGNDKKSREEKMSISDFFKALNPSKKNPAFRLSDLDFYTNELIAFKKAGGNALCDCTPFLPKTDKSQIRDLSKRAGVHIVACTGFYLNSTISTSLWKMGTQGMKSLMEKEIVNGFRGSGVKPGFIKCALGTLKDGSISPKELQSLRACGEIAAKYGMSLHVHSGFPLLERHLRYATDILLKEIGMNQERVILCHMDGWGMRAANPSAANAEGFDLSVVLGYLEKGFNIGFDCWGDPMAPFQNTESRDIIRYKMLCELIRSGYTSQIVLGHDMMNKTGGIQSGKYGYTRFPTFVPQKLKNDGFEDKVYNQMTVGNPARILAY